MVTINLTREEARNLVVALEGVSPAKVPDLQLFFTTKYKIASAFMTNGGTKR